MNYFIFVSFYFPPDGGAGTQRSAKIAQHIRDFGWEPIVVTRSVMGHRGEWDPMDDTLTDHIRDIRVCRIDRSLEPAEWTTGALDAIRGLIQELAPKAIVLTMSPFFLASPVLALGREFGLPVVFDLRDPWALDGWPTYRSWWHWRRDLVRMRTCLTRAQAVVANTPEAATAIAALLGDAAIGKIVTIPNGFDPEDLEIESVRFTTDSPTFDRKAIRIVHTGTFHCKWLYPSRSARARLTGLLRYRAEPIQISGRTPFHLLRAIRLLRDSDVPDAQHIRVCLLGASDIYLQRVVAESGMGDIVDIHGYMSHEESVTHLFHSDLLFIPLHGLPSGHRSRIVPGKLYEYLASGTPILACLPEGDARDLVASAPHGYIADPCDDQQIAEVISAFLRDRMLGRTSRCVPVWLGAYSRRNIALQFADVLNRTSSSAPLNDWPDQVVHKP